MDLHGLARKITVVTLEKINKLKEWLSQTQKQGGTGIMMPDNIQKEIIEHPEDIIVWHWTDYGLIFQMRGDIAPYLFPLMTL